METAEPEASLRSLLRNLSHLYVRFVRLCLTKQGQCGFEHRLTFVRKKKNRHIGGFSFWWRRRYSKPRPKISPRNFLRAYSLYKHSLRQKPNDRRLISVALLCVMSYKAVAHSHLLLLDAPFGTAVLPEGTAALIRQQVKLRFCRLFLNFEAFMVVPRHRSLITTQNPRRNPFVPVSYINIIYQISDISNGLRKFISFFL